MSFFDELIDGFTGKGQRKDLKRSQAQSSAALNSGYNSAKGFYEGGNANTQARLDPFAESGQKSLSLYDDYLGVNGADARASFFSDFAQMPGEFQAAQDYGIRAIDRSGSANGMTLSGGMLEGLHDFGMKNYADFLNPYLDRLGGQAQQGASIAGQQAGYDYGTGTQLGDLAFGKAQLDANNYTNYGNAMAQSRSIPINNLLATLNTVANFIPGAGGGPTDASGPRFGAYGGGS